MSRSPTSATTYEDICVRLSEMLDVTNCTLSVIKSAEAEV